MLTYVLFTIIYKLSKPKDDDYDELAAERA
jgi:hypothetical protein